MRSARRRRRRARLHPHVPKTISERAAFERRYAVEIHEAWVDDGNAWNGAEPHEGWSGQDEECPCCRDRREEHARDVLWDNVVPLVPCDKHLDCVDNISVGWACATYALTRGL